MSQPAGAIRALTTIAAVAVLALTLAAGAEAGGKQGKAGKAKVALRTTSQSALTGTGEVDATPS